ncbi:MAG TPA: protein kinase [Candidatus Nanoarchaeia archaeon]|nr:protein kinase [Candidatus Nanoarchaeia archaeon]
MSTLPELYKTIIGPSLHGRRYVIDKELGFGGFGLVCRVLQEESLYASPTLRNQHLALKVYHSASYQRPVLDEIIHMMSVGGSSCTVQFFDRSPLHAELEYVVMEYVPETMKTKIVQSQQGHATRGLVELYLQEIPWVLGTLRSAGVVHCDIKPSNIGIKNGHLKLLDFGLARMSGAVSDGMPKKRASYPPEIREGIVTPALDMYCAGKVLEWIITGAHVADVQETIENIELFHDIILPVPWRKMFLSMLHPDYKQRAHPEQLHQLMADAVKDMDTLSFKDMVPLSKAELLPSSSSLFG